MLVLGAESHLQHESRSAAAPSQNEVKLKTCNGFDVDTRCKEILTDVLKLHPEYLAKSSIIKSFAVDNHEVYTDTRCFFIN